MTEKEFAAYLREDYIERVRREKERRLAQIEDDLEARRRDFERYADKQFERISEVEASEFARSAGERERPTRPTVVVP